MPVMVVVEEAQELTEGVWVGSLPPHEVQRIDNPQLVKGPSSVLFVGEGNYDKNNKSLSFDIAEAKVANEGTSHRTIVISLSEVMSDFKPHSLDDSIIKASRARLSLGDQEFLDELELLPHSAKHAGEKILKTIRMKSPGQMQRGTRRNFKNTPDNFWYVIVQPQKGNLSITVRGLPETFKPSSLDLKNDRPGYTRFYVNGPNDVKEALRIIFASKKRR